MSIEKIEICLQAKLKRRGQKVIAKTPFKEIIINSEDAKIIPLLRKKRCIGDLAKLLKKDVGYILKKAVSWEESGFVYLNFFCEDPVLKRIYKNQDVIANIYKNRLDICNITAYEKEWRKYPVAFDFLNKDSDNYQLKDFEKEVYFNAIRPFLKRLPEKAVILDAGGGIGRFACKFVKMGYNVHLLDSSLTALKKALRHLLQIGNVSDFNLHWRDAANLSLFSDGIFDSVCAIELICYCSNPERILRELARVTKKNGLIIISVEGKYGAALSDHNVSLRKLNTILKNDLLYIKNYLYVHYYTPNTLSKLLEKCGIEVLDILGCHYVADGIFHRLIKKDKLSDEKYRKNLLNIEESCRQDPVLKNLPRVWLAIGRRK